MYAGTSMGGGLRGERGGGRAHDRAPRRTGGRQRPTLRAWGKGAVGLWGEWKAGEDGRQSYEIASLVILLECPPRRYEVCNASFLTWRCQPPQACGYRSKVAPCEGDAPRDPPPCLQSHRVWGKDRILTECGGISRDDHRVPELGLARDLEGDGREETGAAVARHLASPPSISAPPRGMRRPLGASCQEPELFLTVVIFD